MATSKERRFDRIMEWAEDRYAIYPEDTPADAAFKNGLNIAKAQMLCFFEDYADEPAEPDYTIGLTGDGKYELTGLNTGEQFYEAERLEDVKLYCWTHGILAEEVFIKPQEAK